MDLDPSLQPPRAPSIFQSPHSSSDDLEFNFQNLNLTQKEEIQIDFEDKGQEPISTQFNLLFKVGPPVGSASRNISLNMFETAMRAGWGHRFYRVSQIVPNLFMAHFKEEDDLRWIWQKQPWLVGKETMLVEWIDPKGGTPMESFKFLYLPVTVHLYGIPKTFRSVDLVKRIIQKIGFKDESVVLSENAMFRSQEYIMARVILDVSKPLIDCLTIKISEQKRIKVYVHYEKLAKICSFCGCLFHNVSACLKRQQIIWKLNPKEADKVPEEVYGKWRIFENEIPKEAKEVSDPTAHNAYIQSFKEYFQRISENPSSPSSAQQSKQIQESITVDKQLMIISDRQQPRANENEQRNSSDIHLSLEETRKGNQKGGKLESEARKETPSSALIPYLGQADQVQGGSGMSGTMRPSVFNFQAHQFQSQTQQMQQQLPFSNNQQWQQQLNPFIFQGASQYTVPFANLQDMNAEGTQTEIRASNQLPAPTINQTGILPSPPHYTHQLSEDRSTPHITHTSGMANIFSMNQLTYTNHPGSNQNRKPPKKKPQNPPTNQSVKRHGSPLLPPSSKKPTSPPLLPTPRRRHGSHGSRWDQEASDGGDKKFFHQPLHAICGAQGGSEQYLGTEVLQLDMVQDNSLAGCESEQSPPLGADCNMGDVSHDGSAHCNQFQAQDPGGHPEVHSSQTAQDDPDAAMQDCDGASAPALKAPRAP